MSNLLACATGALIPVRDPTGEENKAYEVIKNRIATEQLYKDLNATEYEVKESNLRRIIRESHYEIDAALILWATWVRFRHENRADEITDQEVEFEMNEGRMFKPQERSGTQESYKKFVVRTVESGLKEADAGGVQDKICIIYDRRGLENSNIDAGMYKYCTGLLRTLQDLYLGRIGAIYVIHTSLVYWLFCHLWLRPVMGFLSGENRVFCVENPKDLLEYFDEEQLQLLAYGEPVSAEKAPESASVEKAPEPEAST